MTGSYIAFTLKLESVSKVAIFGLNMMVKSGLAKFILKSLHAGNCFLLGSIHIWRQILYYISLFSKIRCSLTYLPKNLTSYVNASQDKWAFRIIFDHIYQLLFFRKLAKSVNENICILCHNFKPNEDLETLSTSKWPSKPQFCGR